MSYRIELPDDLAKQAKRQAKAIGEVSVSAYVARLIREDVAAGRDGKPARASDAVRRMRAVKLPKSRLSTRALRQRTLDGMMTYMKWLEEPGCGYACGYTKKDIDRCAAAIDSYLAKLSSTPRRDQAKLLDCVKSIVLRLNKVNAAVDRALIETDQREELCELIVTAARRAGLKAEHDVTEEWREW
jgi:hypothetical protein